MTNIINKIAIGLFAGVLTSNIVVAQQTEEITVQASRIVAKKVGQSPTTGAPIVSMSLSYGVSYAGLDLAKRVNETAQKACQEITRQYPLLTQSDAECVKTAVDKAMVKVNEVVAAASRASK
jgi:hypothetical protein